MAERPSRGLDDVIAASTAVSDMDGRAGRLPCRGYDISQLLGSATFEEIACLAQRGSVPSRGELHGYRAEQHADDRLIRPDSEYIGAGGLSRVPLELK